MTLGPSVIVRNDDANKDSPIVNREQEESHGEL